tara:strand:- start:1568 stop:3316 length:1749 start_codon:yes stop_codon:yes gene_type:complete
MSNNSLNKDSVINIFIIISSIYFLFPLLQSGYVSDDAYNSLIKGSMLEKNQTFNKYVSDLNWGWLKNSGRLYPIEHFSQTFLFYFINNLFVFKIIKLIIILLSVYFFRLNVIVFSKSKFFGNLCVLILLIFFQFRQWHDPILGFAVLIPLICFFLFSSLYYFQIFLENNKKKYLFRSLILYLLLLLTYEISYPLIVLYIAIAFFKSNLFKDIYLKLKFHYILLFLVIIITIYFRLNVGEKSYPSLDQNFLLTPFFKSFGIQIFSGLSFSYFPRLKINFIENLQIADLYLFVFFSIIFYLLNNLNTQKINYQKIIQIFILGILIVLSQSFMVAISGHKNDIINMGLGFGYLPVLLEYFGFSLIYLSILLMIFLRIEKKFIKNLFSIFFSLCLTLNGAINISNNNYVVHETNKFYKYPRDLLKKGLYNKTDNDIKQSTIIIRNWRFPHDINWFYSKHTNKLFCIIDFNKSINESDFSWPSGCALKKLNLEGNKIIFDDSEIIYSISYNFDDTGNQEGQLYYAKIDQIFIDEKSKKIFELKSKELVIYNEKENKFKNFDFENIYNFVDIIKQDHKKKNEVKIPFL